MRIVTILVITHGGIYVMVYGTIKPTTTCQVLLTISRLFAIIRALGRILQVIITPSRKALFRHHFAGICGTIRLLPVLVT
jgi:hypothetical protein